LADVHGNLPALEAALREIKPHGVGTIIVAGDLVFGGEQPLEVWRLLEQVGAKCIRGLSDTALVSLRPEEMKPADDEEQAQLDLFQHTRAALGDLVLERIRRLPLSLRLPLIDGSELLVVHGSPADPMSDITPSMSDDELEAATDDPADLVACGGGHIPFMRVLEMNRVVGLGAVGMAPEGRVAHFMVLRPRMDGAEVFFDHAEY
jgi:predicted phosphodiesterase